MRIVFLGTVQFSGSVLEKLVDLNCDIAAVLTKQRPSFNSDFIDLVPFCKKTIIEYKLITSINLPKTISFLKAKKPDIILCCGWSELIEKKVLDIPRIGVIGYHPALLPRNRGRHPLIWALSLGLKETASTFFFINNDIDSGDILSQKKIKIDYLDTAKTLYKKMTKVSLKQIEELLPLLANKKYTAIKQNEARANYWRKRFVKDGLIDWRMSSWSIYNLVRALTRPYAGAEFIFRDKIVKVWKAREIKNSNYNNIEPGKVIRVYSDGSLLVKSGEHCVKIDEFNPKVVIKEGEYL